MYQALPPIFQAPGNEAMHMHVCVYGMHGMCAYYPGTQSKFLCTMLGNVCLMVRGETDEREMPVVVSRD